MEYGTIRLTGKKSVSRAVIIAAVAIGLLLIGAIPSSAAAAEVPITSVAYPSSVTLQVGEARTLNVATSPSNTTYKTNIEWGSQTNGCFTVKVNGYGTYWNGLSSETLTGTKTGTGYLFITVKVYDSNKRFIRDYNLRTTVNVVKKSSSNPANPTTKAPTKSPTKVTPKAPAAKYWNVSQAYTYLNKFRTTRSNQWYWKSNNRSKTYVYGLKKLKKDSQLEKIAKLRAKEQWVMYYERGKVTHTRPNGKKWSTAYPAGARCIGENLGWGQRSCRTMILDGNYGWAETNYKYSGQGHRRLMLDKSAKRVGIACYEKNGRTCWAMCVGR